MQIGKKLTARGRGKGIRHWRVWGRGLAVVWRRSFGVPDGSSASEAFSP